MSGPTFSIKNFNRFQHYKDRAPPWIKLYSRLLEDQDFGRLPDVSKAHLIAIWLLASRCDNKIPLDAEWVGRRINATDPVDLAKLVDAGFIIPDQPVTLYTKPIASTEREREREREERQSREDRSYPTDTRALARVCVREGGGDFNQFWTAYPHKVGRRTALRAFPAALKRAGGLAVLLDGVERYVSQKPADQLWRNPSTFLNGDHWNDQPGPITKPAADKPHDTIRRALAAIVAEGTGLHKWTPNPDGSDPRDGLPSEANQAGGRTIDLKAIAGGRSAANGR